MDLEHPGHVTEEEAQGDQKDVENITKPAVRASKSITGFINNVATDASAFYNGVGWRSYENYIGAKIFYEGMTKEVENQVLNHPILREQFQKLGNRSSDLVKAKKMFADLAASMEVKSKLRLMAYMMNTFFSRVYHQGIHVKESEIQALKAAALDAEKRGIPIVFLPSHKSHVDYLVISYILFRLGVAVPHIAAGDNLRIPVVGSLLRGCGAFFLRRSFGDDPLYSALFKAYVTVLLERGHNIEVFVEGTRSRTGKLLNPKFGVLKIVLDAALKGDVKDAYMIPTSIGYDKVIETESYIEEMLGSTKKPETLGQVINSTQILNLKLGRIDVRFTKPWLLSEYIADEVKRREMFDPLRRHDHRTLLLKSLAYRVLSDINQVSIVMPTALVGGVLLTLRGRGIGRSELIRKVRWLRGEILKNGGRVAEFGDVSSAVIVDRAVGVLKGLVGMRQDLLEPTFYAMKRFELSYYRNQIMHLFISESVVAVSIYAGIKTDAKHSRVTRTKLLEDVAFVSQLLKDEFIFTPGNIEDNMELTLRSLRERGVIDYDGQVIGLSHEEQSAGRENFDFYCFLIWPFIESYWLAVVSLFAIPVRGMVLEKAFLGRVQRFARTMYYQGDLSYFEAIGQETLKNALARLSDMGVIERRIMGAGGVISGATTPQPSGSSIAPTSPSLTPLAGPSSVAGASSSPASSSGPSVPSGGGSGVLLGLRAEWEERDPKDGPEGELRVRVRLLAEEVGRFRREGKNRRDNSNTSERVLRLARMAGAVQPGSGGKAKL